MGIGTCIYLTASVSATLPPIKGYKYEGSVNQFIKGLQTYVAKHPNTSLVDGDIVGDKKTGLAYDITINIGLSTRVLTYDLRYEPANETGDKAITNIKLIGAHDLTNNTGGYGIKADGMKGLLTDLNLYIFIPLESDQNIRITAL
ncbi:MAG: hypothetical protein JWP94_696 [Mucilaginibacter sp.]|nr:hypothetical protein [Mucilaginibacter sp.]